MDKLKQAFSYTKASQQRRKAKKSKEKQGGKQRTAAAVFFGTFGALPEVHLLHAIYHFKAQEVKNLTLQTVYDLDLKRGRYGLRKTTAPGVREFRTPPFSCANGVRSSYTFFRCAKISHTPCVVRIFPCFCRLHTRSFLLDIFVLISILLLVIHQS